MKVLLLSLVMIFASTLAFAENATEIVTLPFDESRHNVRAFSIKTDDKKVAYVLPKLYAFMGSDIKQSVPYINKKKKTVLLSFPFMMVDGLQSSVISPNSSYDSIQLPEKLLIRNKEELEAKLNATLVAPPSCPSNLTLFINGKAYKDSGLYNQTTGQTLCNYNTVMYTSVEVPLEEAKFLLNDGGLRAGYATLQATVNIYAPYKVSSASISFSKSKVYQNIQAHLSIRKPLLGKADMRMEVEKAVKQAAMDITIQGDINTHLNSIIEQAITAFFTPVPADPAKPDMSCGNEKICFKFNYSYQDFSENFSVNYQVSSNQLSLISFLTETPLRSIFDKEIRFENFSTLGGRLNTGLTVNPYDEVELSFSSLIYETLVQDNQTVTVNNVVSVPYTSTEHCRPSGGGGRSRGGEAGGNADNFCEVTRYKNENRWIATTTYSGKRTLNILSQASDEFAKVTDSLLLEFSWQEDGQAKSVTCPVNSFKRRSIGKGLIIQVTNTPDCKVFTARAQNIPKVALVSDASKNLSIATSKAITVGQVVKNWQGALVKSDLREEAILKNPIVSGNGIISVHYKMKDGSFNSLLSLML